MDFNQTQWGSPSASDPRAKNTGQRATKGTVLTSQSLSPWCDCRRLGSTLASWRWQDINVGNPLWRRTLLVVCCYLLSKPRGRYRRDTIRDVTIVTGGCISVTWCTLATKGFPWDPSYTELVYRAATLIVWCADPSNFIINKCASDNYMHGSFIFAKK